MKSLLHVPTLCLLLILQHTSVYAADFTATPGTDERSPAPYTFAVVPYYSPEKIWSLFTPFVDYISKSTGQSWRLQLYHNYDQFVEDICNGRISLGFTGPLPLNKAHEKCGAEPLLVALAKNGQPVYHSFLVTNDTTIKHVSQLKAKKVGFLKGSSAAQFMPVKMLKKAGVELSDIQPVFLQSQNRIMSALLSGEVVAGGMKETLYQKFEKENLLVLAISDPMPNFALCVLPSFSAKQRELLTSVLLKLRPLANRRDAIAVKEWDDEIKHGFVLPSADFTASIRRIATVEGPRK